MVPLARSLSGAQHNVCMYCFVDFLCLTCAQAKKNLVSFLEIGWIKTFYGSFAAQSNVYQNKYFKFQEKKQKKTEKNKKTKTNETKEEKRISVEDLTGYDR